MRSRDPRILIFSPFRFQHGGGERYTLGIALALSSVGEVTLAFDYKYSKMRLERLQEGFGFSAGAGGSPLNLEFIGDLDLTTFDLCIQIANDISPVRRALGKKNIIHCQFPFPQPRVAEVLKFFNGVKSIPREIDYVANSGFTKGYIVSKLRSLNYKNEVTVIEPHVNVPAKTRLPSQKSMAERPQILSIGRFTNLGHAKNQDKLVLGLWKLRERFGLEARLTLLGGVTSSTDAQFLSSLRHLSDSLGLDVEFLPNASNTEIKSSLESSSIFWHGTGLGEYNPLGNPSRLEHFGIAPLEAMGNGLVPFCYHLGGPASYIEHGKNGFLVANEDELAESTYLFLKSLPEDKQRISSAGRSRAEKNKFSVFADSWRRLVQKKLA